MLGGGAADAAGGRQNHDGHMISFYFQAKTNATEDSSKANAIDQFFGIECSSETKCNEVSGINRLGIGRELKLMLNYDCCRHQRKLHPKQ